MISHSNKRCEILQNSEFSEANAEDLPFPEESFDAACCTQVLLYVNNVDQVLLEIKRTLAGGRPMRRPNFLIGMIGASLTVVIVVLLSVLG